MKAMKKIFGVLLICMLTVCLLAACGGNSDGGKTDENNDHTHTASGDWLFNGESHWKVCAEDEEKLDLAAHTLEKDVCTVCKVKVTKGESTTDVYVLDDKGNWITCTHFDGEKVVSEDSVEYKYMADGNVESMKMTTNGKLVYDAEYGVDEDGFNYEKKSTKYNDDGTKYYCESDSKGDVLKETMYKADGTVEYDYTHTYTYADNAKKVGEKIFSGEKLIKEINYIVLFEDSWGGGSYKLEVITYGENGEKTVEYFTENGEPYTE